ncbi:hypothetical protein FOL47_000232 [Perkinsus chesapeaki]|uniref:Uncharacterized protein n=1 Tax=Perkinsus chesapeaki TaxID=330153 RepID=A0A7J6MM55_PERCH|nr:hypothetical protein FOL47_000232 [Perkinsus chesapeaki]
MFENRRIEFETIDGRQTYCDWDFNYISDLRYILFTLSGPCSSLFPSSPNEEKDLVLNLEESKASIQDPPNPIRLTFRGGIDGGIERLMNLHISDPSPPSPSYSL